MDRHAHRQLVVQALFLSELEGLESADVIGKIEAYVQDLFSEATLTTEVDLPAAELEKHFVIEAFFYTTYEGVLAKKMEIDQVLEVHLDGWKVSRLNRVDQQILRLAVYEMIIGQIPIQVAINEALELTRSFTDLGDNKAVRFNNKVLDKVARTFKRKQEGADDGR